MIHHMAWRDLFNRRFSLSVIKLYPVLGLQKLSSKRPIQYFNWLISESEYDNRTQKLFDCKPRFLILDRKIHAFSLLDFAFSICVLLTRQQINFRHITDESPIFIIYKVERIPRCKKNE